MLSFLYFQIRLERKVYILRNWKSGKIVVSLCHKYRRKYIYSLNNFLIKNVWSSTSHKKTLRLWNFEILADFDKKGIRTSAIWIRKYFIFIRMTSNVIEGHKNLILALTQPFPYWMVRWCFHLYLSLSLTLHIVLS